MPAETYIGMYMAKYNYYLGLVAGTALPHGNNAGCAQACTTSESNVQGDIIHPGTLYTMTAEQTNTKKKQPDTVIILVETVDPI